MREEGKMSRLSQDGIQINPTDLNLDKSFQTLILAKVEVAAKFCTCDVREP